MRHLTAAGLAFLLTGAGCFGAGGFVLTKTLDRNAVQETFLARTERSCREQILKLGGKVVPLPSNVLEVVFDDLKDVRRSLGDSTATLAMCPSRKILELCTGTGCSAVGGTAGTVSSTIRTIIKLGAPT